MVQNDNKIIKYIKMNWNKGFTQKESLTTDVHRVKEIINESYTVEKQSVEKAISMINNLRDSDKFVKKDKENIVRLIMKINNEKSNDEVMNAESELRKILSKNKGRLNAYTSSVRQELD